MEMCLYSKIFVRGVFNDAVTSSVYMDYKERMEDKGWNSTQKEKGRSLV
jgi:hypothetical protein